jgi:hypothetical protein
MNPSKSPNINPLSRQPASTVLTLSLSDSSFSDTSASTTDSTPGAKNFKYSTDSLSSFEDYRIANDTSYVYIKCALPTSRDTCTSDFIKTMCCNCGRG